MSDELSMVEVKGLIDKQNEAWGEFMKKNDALIAAKADGKAVGDIQASLAKLDAEFKSIQDAVKESAKAAARAAIQAQGEGKQATPEAIEHKQKFGHWLRSGKDDGLLEAQAKAMAEFKSLNSGSNVDGGYFVLPELDLNLIRTVNTISAMGRLADSKTISTDAYVKYARTTGMTARRVANGATGGETTNPKYAMLRFEVHVGECEPWIHNETLEDASINLEAELMSEAAISFANLEGNEYLNGTGVGEARGLLTYTQAANASYAWGTLGYIKSGANGAFAASNPSDKIIDLQHSLKQQYRPGAVWLTSDAVLSSIRQMKDGSGNFYLWQPDATGSFGGRLLGHPVEIDDFMPALATGSLSLAFGDFKQAYVTVSRMGTSLIRDSITAKGTTKFNLRRRSGGGVQNFEAYKAMKFSA